MAKGIGYLTLSLVALSLAPSAQEPVKSRDSLEDSHLRWRLLPAEQAYLSIDGKHLKQYVETVCAAIAQLLGSFTAEECPNYFTNAGYGSIKLRFIPL